VRHHLCQHSTATNLRDLALSLTTHKQFIIGFRKEQVNANLLNGKGEIKNVELNCSFLNEQIMKVSPFIELESVHVSKLSFHVSSWANLRQSPICIDIEHVTAKILEPLHYLDRKRRNPLRQLTRHEYAQLIRQGALPKPRTGSYNLLDRILDNLTVEIRSIHVTFQPAGKFKTRRVGPWTPPAIRLQLFGVRLVSVNEFGNEASPDEVWRHNHHRRGREGNFLIYKKLETEYKVSLVVSNSSARRKKKKSPPRTNSAADDVSGESEKNEEELAVDTDTGPVKDGDNTDDEIVIPLVSSTPKDGSCNNRSKVEVQLAFQRRIRDGEYLAVQIDTTIPVVEIELLASTVPHLAHLLAAITYLLGKDRAFVDPLRSASSGPASPASSTGPKIVSLVSSESLGGGEEVDLTAQSILEIAMEDGLSESSEEEEENDDKQKLDNSIIDEDEEGTEYEVEVDSGLSEPAATEESVASNTPATSQQQPPVSSSDGPPRKPVPQAPVTPGPAPKSNDDRPVLVLPNGIVFHDKISISVSIHHVTFRGTYRDSVDGHIQVVANGVVAEAIWPQVTKVSFVGDRLSALQYRLVLTNVPLS